MLNSLWGPEMNRFRENFFSKLLTLITALIFLNMSFFLAEVSMLDLANDGRFSKVISLVLSGTCFEEEKETGGDTTEEDTSAKKIEVVLHSHHTAFDAFIILTDLNWGFQHAFLVCAVHKKFTPPPESMA